MPFWGAAAGALALLVALDLPRTITRVAAGYAAEGGPAERATALAALRTLGSRDALLRLSYVRTSMGMDVLGSLLAPARHAAAGAHALLPHDRAAVQRRAAAAGAPDARGPHRLRAGLEPGPGRPRGRRCRREAGALLLADRRLVDAQAALAYLEWTLEFRNDSADAQEARVQVALPPGAVVSRLTLWIDGQEREAAFGTRAQTRGAYETVVVRQRRDPVLVTTAGRDRVLLQCFPVPAGGTMKTRVGITAPLDLRSLREGRLMLPRLVERNFQVPGELRHSVWVEATGTVTGAGLAPTARDGGASLRGALSDRELLAETAALTVARDAVGRRHGPWTHTSPSIPAIVRQRLADARAGGRPRRGGRGRVGRRAEGRARDRARAHAGGARHHRVGAAGRRRPPALQRSRRPRRDPGAPSWSALPSSAAGQRARAGGGLGRGRA
jgi:hypothetical protein